MVHRLLQLIDARTPRAERGDLLVFVAGAEDIAGLGAALRPYAAQTGRWAVLPLHSGLSVEEQDKVGRRPWESERGTCLGGGNRGCNKECRGAISTSLRSPLQGN